jgi:putative ABC transport system permease protein
LKVFQTILSRLAFYYQLALESLMERQLRMLLAGLGVMFGVASVIAMLAVGKGAKQEILSQLKLIGGNSIVIQPLNNTQSKVSFTKPSRGLCLQDAQNIKEVFPNLAFISPEISLKILVVAEQKWLQSSLYGIENSYFEIIGLHCKKGNLFSKNHIIGAEAVCVIGSSMEAKLFGGKSALGQYIRCDDQWLKVVGVLDTQPVITTNFENLGIHNTNNSVYTPITSLIRRFNYKKNHKAEQNIHQLTRLVVQVQDAVKLIKTAETIQAILLRLHNGQPDFDVIVPEQILKERQKTQEMLNYVLGAIAGISLLIGGIGIMNIMLTSVLERTKEIGIRKVVGATQIDIRNQFLVESIVICLLGGLAGILVGFLISWIIHKTMEINILIEWTFTLGAFFITIFIGIAFGWYPAKQASIQTPHDLLRYE